MYKSKVEIEFILSILTGLAGYAVIGSFGLYLLKVCWIDYAKSSVDKSYTLEMLMARLFIAIMAAITASILTTRTSKRQGKAIWFVALIIFSSAAYVHFFRVWADYPVWYHLTYLLSIIPTIKLTNYYLTERDLAKNKYDK